MKRLAALLGTGTLLALAVCTGPASAAGNSAANGGAANMLADPTMLSVPMVNNENNPTASASAFGSYGNAGMFCAVFVTTNSASPGGCNGHQ
jgi:hypothetical protein